MGGGGVDYGDFAKKSSFGGKTDCISLFFFPGLSGLVACNI
jgi:hypothetical protein